MRYSNKAPVFLKRLSSFKECFNVWGLDVETENLDGKNTFQMCSIVGDCGIKKFFWNREDFIKELNYNYELYSSGKIFCTNAEFDVLTIFKNSDEMKKLQLNMHKGRFICAYYQTNDRKIKFLDTLNFIKLGVEKLGKLVDTPKLKSPENLGKIKTENMSFLEKAKLEAYNYNDSLITYKAAKLLQKGFNSLGGKMRNTISSTALDIYRRKYMPFDIPQLPKSVIDLSRFSLYGGRTEAIKRGNISNLNLKQYDINSMYPAMMLSHDYPDPRSYYKVNHYNPDIFEREGFSDVTLESGGYYIPILPFRHNNKLVFPNGTFRGFYTHAEIRNALYYGYSVEKYHSGYCFSKSFQPFNDYVRDIYDLRLKYQKEKNPLEITAKLLLNGLYGKWGQKTDDYEHIVLTKYATEKDFKNASSWTRDYLVLNKKFSKMSDFINPLLSAYTTSYARILLNDYIMKYQDVFYMDTDCIITTHDLEDSSELGELKKVCEIKKGCIVKPKMYYINEDVKIKGFSKATKNSFDNILNNKSVEYMKFTKYRESIKRGFDFSEIKTIEKTFGLEDDKRTWSEKFNPEVLQDSQPLIF